MGTIGERGAASRALVWTVAAALLGVILAYLPVFLLAGLGTIIRDVLGLSLIWLGIGTAAFFVASAISAALVGGLCDRIGGVAVLRIGSSLSAFALVLMALSGLSVWLMSIGLLVGGAANGLSQTAANVILHDFVRHDLQGRLFAVKQSAAPAVTFIAGLAISVFVPVFPWQAVLVGAALLFYVPAMLSWRALPRRATTQSRAEQQRFRLRSEPALFVLAFVSFLAFAAATAGVAYFVETLSGVGFRLDLAGRLLMAGSIAGIAARLIIGVVLDRFDLPPLLVCMTMLAIGAIGFLVVVDAPSTPLLVGATVLIFGAGWGWPGLFVLGVVRSYPEKAGWASGMAQFGSALGAAVGPFLFGAASAGVSFRFAWWSGGFAMFVAATVLYAHHRRTATARASTASSEVVA